MIGAGSGGIASARRAAGYGAKVAVVERGALGGTCVNVGCVPKKVMFNAAHVQEVLHDAPLYHYKNADAVALDWGKLKAARDAYVTRLNGIYARNLENSGVTKLEGLASFVSNNEVKVGDATYTADHVLVAVGGAPSFPDLDGAEHCLSSDGFFALEDRPDSCLVVGAGSLGRRRTSTSRRTRRWATWREMSLCDLVERETSPPKGIEPESTSLEIGDSKDEF